MRRYAVLVILALLLSVAAAQELNCWDNMGVFQASNPACLAAFPRFAPNGGSGNSSPSPSDSGSNNNGQSSNNGTGTNSNSNNGNGQSSNSTQNASPSPQWQQTNSSDATSPTEWEQSPFPVEPPSPFPVDAAASPPSVELSSPSPVEPPSPFPVDPPSPSPVEPPSPSPIEVPSSPSPEPSPSPAVPPSPVEAASSPSPEPSPSPAVPPSPSPRQPSPSPVAPPPSPSPSPVIPSPSPVAAQPSPSPFPSPSPDSVPSPTPSPSPSWTAPAPVPAPDNTLAPGDSLIPVPGPSDYNIGDDDDDDDDNNKTPALAPSRGVVPVPAPIAPVPSAAAPTLEEVLVNATLALDLVYNTPQPVLFNDEEEQSALILSVMSVLPVNDAILSFMSAEGSAAAPSPGISTQTIGRRLFQAGQSSGRAIVLVETTSMDLPNIQQAIDSAVASGALAVALQENGLEEVKSVSDYAIAVGDEPLPPPTIPTQPPAPAPSDQNSLPAQQTSGSDDSGLSTGAIVGICVGVAVLALVGLALLAYFVLRSKKKPSQPPVSTNPFETSPLSFEDRGAGSTADVSARPQAGSITYDEYKRAAVDGTLSPVSFERVASSEKTQEKDDSLPATGNVLGKPISRSGSLQGGLTTSRPGTAGSGGYYTPKAGSEISPTPRATSSKALAASSDSRTSPLDEPDRSEYFRNVLKSISQINKV